MRRAMPSGLTAACFALLTVVASGPADARLTVCNRTNDAVRVALGREEGGRWLSRGWWTAGPGACVRIVDEPLRLLEYYVFAESLSAGMALGGAFPFCVAPEDFEIEDNRACEARGHREVRFSVITTDGATSLVHNLSPKS